MKSCSHAVITMCLKDLNLRLEFAEKKGQVDKMDKIDKRRVTVFHALEMSFLWAFCLFFPSHSSMFISSETFLPRPYHTIIMPSSCHHAICQLSSILVNQVWLSCDSKLTNSEDGISPTRNRKLSGDRVLAEFFWKKTAPRFAPWSRGECGKSAQQKNPAAFASCRCEAPELLQTMPRGTHGASVTVHRARHFFDLYILLSLFTHNEN